ncbi:MAG: hypothetical protein O9972_01735, partial [Burkholderiales bacterium]|nr:hypothetical protein [Burkholderiales bacterium]
MRHELESVLRAIDKVELAPEFDDQFGSMWSVSSASFHTQETYILDYKETHPVSFTEPYGASIVRLALAFFNSFGGMIIFGIN